ncbi:MAG: hypothetical protein QOI55_1878, partial [Actinomycetota bacterium]|nr:hypothetical protein [Actinomycetota bacterium]
SPRNTLLTDAAREAYVHAFDATLVIAATVAVLAAGLIAWLLRPAAAEPVELTEIELEAA